MKRSTLLEIVVRPASRQFSLARFAAVLLALAGTACGDDGAGSGGGSTSAGSGGSDGSGGEAASATTTSGATTTASSAATTTATTTASSAATTTGGTGGAGTGGSGGDASGSGGSGGSDGSGGSGEAACDDLPAACAADWEQTASDSFDALVVGDPDDLALFLRDVPKGADLHNHLSGAVYAETYLEWAERDDICIEPDTFRAETSCDASNDPVPSSGDAFYQDIVEAWSMDNFVEGAENGHDHFFATFGKFGAIAGTRRNDSLADIATRAAEENIVHLETMFNLGKNIGDLSDDIWVGTLTEADLPGLYADIMASSLFDAEIAKDVNVVTSAYSAYRSVLGCSAANPPAACDVGMRFTAQVSRTGGKPIVFGQLISAFEMAKRTPYIVAANLSSPEDDTTSINNYNLHMAMLDFLHEQYTETGDSPLEITLHAGELTAEYVPAGSEDALTFHVRAAVEVAQADRIGHGLDIFSETDPAGLMAEMADLGVLVEVCLSSNVQILEVSGSDHPLADYIAAGVPVALATDDQGVSRSSLAGEYLLAATDQQLSYRQLKRMARDSLEHAFLPGDSLWDAVEEADPVGDCEPTATMGVGSEPNALCQGFLDESERARAQWELERRFRIFESNL